MGQARPTVQELQAKPKAPLRPQSPQQDDSSRESPREQLQIVSEASRMPAPPDQELRKKQAQRASEAKSMSPAQPVARPFAAWDSFQDSIQEERRRQLRENSKVYLRSSLRV